MVNAKLLVKLHNGPACVLPSLAASTTFMPTTVDSVRARRARTDYDFVGFALRSSARLFQLFALAIFHSIFVGSLGAEERTYERSSPPLVSREGS